MSKDKIIAKAVCRDNADAAPWHVSRMLKLVDRVDDLLREARVDTTPAMPRVYPIIVFERLEQEELVERLPDNNSVGGVTRFRPIRSFLRG